MPLSAVVFDLDYTLVVPDRPREAVLQDAIEAVGAPAFTRSDYQDAHADHLDAASREPIFAQILPEDDDTDPADMADAYREHVNDSLRPVDGLEGLLADLRSDYALGLLTNGAVRAQQSKLDRFDWVDAFDATVVTGDLEAGKPDERAFEAILDALDVPAGQAVYVGDQPESDIRGAQAAGMTAVQVVFDGGPDRDPAADAHVERDALATELPRVLAAL